MDEGDREGPKRGPELARYLAWVAQSAVKDLSPLIQITDYHRNFPGRVLPLAVELIAAATNEEETDGAERNR